MFEKGFIRLLCIIAIVYIYFVIVFNAFFSLTHKRPNTSTIQYITFLCRTLRKHFVQDIWELLTFEKARTYNNLVIEVPKNMIAFSFLSQKQHLYKYKFDKS